MNRRMWGEERRAMPVVVGVDVGSVGVRVVVTTLEDEPRPYAATSVSRAAAPPRTLRVLGVGEAPTRGLRRGSLLDPQAVGESLREAVREAEVSAGHRVLRASLAVPLTLFETANGGARVTLPTPAAVRAITKPNAPYAAAWDEAAEVAGIEWAGVLPSAVAAVASTALHEEVAAGVALVECGAEQTSVAIANDTGVQRVVCLPVGGDHITRDLATLLGVRPAEAERLKLLVGNIRNPAHTELATRGADGSRKTVAVALVVAIVAARVEQIMGRVAEVIRPAAGEGGAARGTAQSVVLCGGGSALSGVAHVARVSLGLPVRVAGPWGVAGVPEAQVPGYAAALGTVRWWEVAYTARAAGARATAAREERLRSATNTSQSRWQSWLREFIP